MTKSVPPENALPRVELWSGRIPLIGWFAHHYWFVVQRNGKRERWEVWQTRASCPESWGYLHKNLMAPEAWIKRQPCRLVAEWAGDDVAGIVERIESSPQTYPWRERYRYWPGPNSNTYAQWILGDSYVLGARGLGKEYSRRGGGVR